MIKSRAHTVWFGDAEREFRLTPPLIIELEIKCNVGIGGLCRRLFAGDFRFQELTEIIRLALIGGGETPLRASQLVDAYVNSRPLGETFPLAVAILECLFFGAAKEQSDLSTDQPKDEQT